MGASGARASRVSVCLCLALGFAAVAVGCGGGDSSSPSAASLTGLLPPPTHLGPLTQGPTFKWDNSTDFVVQGTVLPELTPPSSAISKVDDAGFQAGVGELLPPKGGGSPVTISVASFDAADGATQAQDYLHAQDLTQPCAEACTVNPRELQLKGVPNSTAVHQVPINGKVPSAAGRPFEAFAAEFTIGSDLFYAQVSASPGDIPASAFERGIAGYYQYARKHA